MTDRDKFHVTFFEDERAQTLSAKEMTLDELRDLVLNTTAATKAGLPLLKLAKFGDKRTENNSLRSNGNVTAITGVEGDYDNKRMSLDDAVKVVEQARLKVLLYTSPSHTNAEPKWRIILPTSRDLQPSERVKLTARVNGLFNGALAGESFTLSQSYYYGHINNSDHRAVVIDDGDFIDLRTDLDATAVGKKGASFDNVVEFISRADGQRQDKRADPDLIYAAMCVIPNDNLDWNEWNNMGMAIFNATNGHQRGSEAFDVWSRKNPIYNQDRTRERWQHYFSSPPTEIGAGTIIQKANEALPGWRALVGLSIDKVKEVIRLSALAPAQYEQQREEAAGQLGLRRGVLDNIVQSLQFWSKSDGEEEDGQGTRIEIDPTSPWADLVDGQVLVDDMSKTIRGHVILSEHQALTVALWVIHTYAIDEAEHTPRLQIRSPTKRCGKTTLLNTIKPMVSKCVNTENITMAALFRLTEMFQPTLLIDEADTFFKREDGKNNEDINAIMNAGHGRGGTVIRVVGEKFEVRAFQVFAPVAFAWLVKRNMQPSPTLEDRSITIELRRRLKTEEIVRLRSNRTGHLQLLGRKAARWAADHRASLADADPELPEELGDRDHDNWRPLIAIADAISESLSKKARAAALKIAEEDTGGEEDASVTALADVAAIFKYKEKKWKEAHPDEELKGLKVKDLVDIMVKMTDRSWPDWHRGIPLTEKGLRKLLKGWGLQTKRIRIGSERAGSSNLIRGYETGEVLEVAAHHVDVETTEEEIMEAVRSLPGYM